MLVFLRGVSFVEIYLLRRFKANKIWSKYFHQSKLDHNTYKILRRKKSSYEHSDNRFKSESCQKVVVDDNKNRELPEEPTTCCMSGCANCIWLEYAEKLSKIFKDGGDKAIQQIHEKVNDPNLRAFILQELKLKKLD